MLTISQTKDYLFRQCSRSFARVMEADAGDTAFLFDMLKEGKRRFTETDKLMIQEELRRYEKAS